MQHVLLRKLAVLVLVAFRLAIRTPATAARVVTTSLLLADGICNAVCNWCNCAVLRASGNNNQHEHSWQEIGKTAPTPHHQQDRNSRMQRGVYW